jgi:sugar lactone lactonase YvrE
VTAEGESRIVAEDFAFPNGSLITSDHQLIVSETFGNRLVAFQIADDGSLFQRRSFADLEQVSPDGICLDAAGAIWVAAARQSLFVRVFEGGRISHWVHTPGHQAVACQLGGPDGRTLFCLTLAQDFVEDGQDGVATSRVEITRVDVPRAGSP